MAKKTNPQIKAKLLAHIEKLWDKYNGKFFVGVEEAETKKGTIDFTAVIDLSEAAPVVTTQVSFKDKTKEAGMDVVKSFSAEMVEELDDPQQSGLGKILDEAAKGSKKPDGESGD
mgnify:CR=1 FL=1